MCSDGSRISNPKGWGGEGGGDNLFFGHVFAPLACGTDDSFDKIKLYLKGKTKVIDWEQIIISGKKVLWDANNSLTFVFSYLVLDSCD